MPVVLAASVENAEILLSLFLILLSAKLMAELFERLRQPAVVGEILAGVVIGPSLLGWVAPSDLIGVLAEIGVIFLLFNVGLETKPKDILQVGVRALVVAVLGVVLPFIAGYLTAIWWGSSFIEAMFIGAALVATLREWYPQMKVLYISGYSNEYVEARGGSVNGSAFLAKPFSLEALSARVREVLDGEVAPI